MSWIKLDDGFGEHSKVERLSDSAFRAHVSALCYCGRQLTDGRLEPRTAKRLAGEAIPELVAAKLWEPHGDGFLIHDYLDYNPTREEVEQERAGKQEAKSRAGKLGMHRRWHSQTKSEGCPYCITEPITPVITDAYQSDNKTITPSPSPSPSPFPVPDPEKKRAADKPPRVSAPRVSPQMRELVTWYVGVMPDRRGYSLNAERQRVLTKAFSEFGLDDLKEAVRIFATHPAYAFNRGENDTGKKYNGLCEYILSHRGCKVDRVTARVTEVLNQGGWEIEDETSSQAAAASTGGLSAVGQPDRGRDGQSRNGPDPPADRARHRG